MWYVKLTIIIYIIIMIPITVLTIIFGTWDKHIKSKGDKEMNFRMGTENEINNG